MKLFIFFLTLLFSLSSLSAQLNLQCSNIKGVDLRYEDGKIDSSSDGYSGTTFLLRIGDDTNGYIKWSGGFNDGFTEELTVLNVNNKDGWISWVAIWPEVTRIYTVFLGALFSFVLPF